MGLIAYGHSAALNSVICVLYGLLHVPAPFAFVCTMFHMCVYSPLNNYIQILGVVFNDGKIQEETPGQRTKIPKSGEYDQYVRLVRECACYKSFMAIYE